MFLIHSELYFAYILFGLTKYKKVCFLNFGFNLRYFLGVIKYLYDYFLIIRLCTCYIRNY